jgi:hypothetical protein
MKMNSKIIRIKFFNKRIIRITEMGIRMWKIWGVRVQKKIFKKDKWNLLTIFTMNNSMIKTQIILKHFLTLGLIWFIIQTKTGLLNWWWKARIYTIIKMDKIIIITIIMPEMDIMIKCIGPNYLSNSKAICLR